MNFNNKRFGNQEPNKKKFMRKINKIGLFVLTTLAVSTIQAASPFANVPLYLSKIESIKTKSNLMLVIDDSGSMHWFTADGLIPEQPKAIESGNRMDQAITSAINIISDPIYQKQFNFGVAHLRTTDYRIEYGNYYDYMNVSEDGIRNNLNTVLVPIGDPEKIGHFNNLKSEIQRLRAFEGTPIYEKLSNVYPIVADAMQYRCQKNFVILITDGEPTDTNSFPNKALGAATKDWKVTGNDAEGKSWNENPWQDQTIKTSVIAFLTDIPAMKDLANDGGGSYMTVNNLNGLQDAISVMMKNLTKSPNPVPAAPAISQVNGSNLNALSVRLYTDVGNWSSQLRLLQFNDANNSEETVGEKLKYKSPSYGKEAIERSTVINTPTNGIQSLDRGRLGSGLDNNVFDITGSAPDHWQNKYIPWLDSWHDVADDAYGYRSRSSKLNDEERFLGDVLGGAVLGAGKLSDYTLRAGITTKVNEFILVNSNDGMLKIYQYQSGNANNPYSLRFNYIAGAAERENGRRMIQDLKDRASKRYGETSNPHLYFGNGDMSQLTSPRGQSIVVSTLGQGGRGAFALNLSGVKDTDTSEKVGLDVSGLENWKDSVPLWDTSAKINERSSSSVITDMGYTIGRPTIDLVALKRNADEEKIPVITGSDADVRMVAFVANGYETTNLSAKPTLHVIDAIGSKMTLEGAVVNNSAGQILKSFVLDKNTVGVDVGAQMALASPTAVDLDADDIADLVYAGDQNGNIYRFDLRAEDISKWKASVLFKGSSTRPVTIAPKVYRKNDNTMVVLFGTGSEIYETDGNISNADSEKEENLQEMYGIIDNLSSDTAVTVIRSDLLEQKITTVLDDQYRETSTSDLAGGDKGWRLSLTPRERIVKDIEVYNGTVFFNTTIIKPMEQPPANAVCFASEAQGSGWSMELKAATGAMPGIKDAHIHTMTDGSGVTKSVSGLYIKGFTLGSPSIIKPTINAHTNQPYAHDYNGVRTVSGQAGFGLKSLLSGKYLGSRPGQEKGLRAAKCVKAENEQKAWIAIPDSSAGKDQENIPYVGKEILGGCHLGGSVVKRLSWRRIY